MADATESAELYKGSATQALRMLCSLYEQKNFSLYCQCDWRHRFPYATYAMFPMLAVSQSVHSVHSKHSVALGGQTLKGIFKYQVPDTCLQIVL